MKWIHEVKWNKKLKRKQHTYKRRADYNTYGATITHIVGVPTEWRYGRSQGGACGSVEEAQGVITGIIIAERMTR